MNIEYQNPQKEQIYVYDPLIVLDYTPKPRKVSSIPIVT